MGARWGLGVVLCWGIQLMETLLAAQFAVSPILLRQPLSVGFAHSLIPNCDSSAQAKR
jgi:hypothetical protein